MLNGDDDDEAEDIAASILATANEVERQDREVRTPPLSVLLQ